MKKPFKCSYCPLMFGLISNVRQHIKRCHPGSEVVWVDVRTLPNVEEYVANEAAALHSKMTKKKRKRYTAKAKLSAALALTWAQTSFNAGAPIKLPAYEEQ